MGFRGAFSLLLAVAAAAVALPARAQTRPPAPTVEPEAPPAPPPPESGPPGVPAPPAEPAPAEQPPPAEPPPPPPAEAPPVPATVPSTWGPTRPDESIVAESAPPMPAPRPKLSAAVGMGGSLDSVGFDDGSVRAIPSFFTVLGIGDGPLGFDISAFASQALGRHRDQDPVDRLSVDAFGVLRPGSWHRPDDRSFEMRVLHALAVELGLGFERDGRTSTAGAVSGTRFLIHTGARADIPISPADGEPQPQLYGASVSDFTSVHDSAAEVYAAVVVVF